MFTVFKCLPVYLALVVVPGFAAVPPAEKLLPSDTLAFLTVPDWSQAQSNFSTSALGQFWNDPSMKAFKEKFIEKFNNDTVKALEKELGLKFSDYTSLAQGQFTLAVVPNGWDGRSDKQPGLVWIVDTKEKSSQLKTNLTELRKKWTDAGKKIRADKIRDVEFTTVIVDPAEFNKSLEKIVPGQKPPPAAGEEPKPKKTIEWVIGQSGSLLLVSDAPKDVEKVLALQSGASVPALADQAAFAANAQMLRGAQTFAWVNVKPIMATLARRPEPRPEGESLLGAPPSMERILNATGFGGVQSLAANLTQGHDGSMMNISINVPENARKGLMNILAVNAKDAAPPPFIPADAVKFSRWRIDLQKGWTTVENMLVEISPAYAGFSKLILDTAGKDKDPNFDFRKQLLANLGDDVMTYEKAPRSPSAEDLNSPPSVTLLGAKNAEQLASSMKAITSIFPPNLIKYREREFLGRTVYSITLPNAGAGEGGARPLSYAASGGYVAFSTDVAALEEYLRSGEGTVKPLRDFPGLNDSAQKVGGTGSGYFSFENQNETTRAAFETAKKDPKAVSNLFGTGQLVTLLGLAGGADEKGMSEWFDFSLLPPFDRVSKFFGYDVSAINVSPTAISFKMFTPTPPQLRK
ncbi:MAG TPA: hypothetical protein VM029_07040 [Opitutaceae bacterium]|nr:hypothetical protein [Opitutaceae bacterium]